MAQAQGCRCNPYAHPAQDTKVSTLLAAMILATPVVSALANVGRLQIQHRTERRRLELVERLAAKHGIDAVSSLSELVPPEIPGGMRSSLSAQSSSIK